MKPYHVLVPVDDPAFVAPCLSQIKRFFAPPACHISLLRVAEPPDTLLATPEPFIHYYSHPGAFEPFANTQASAHPIYADQIEQSLLATIEQELRPLMLDLEAAGYQVSIATRFGDPAPEILEFIQASEVDLICMATHGRTGLSRLVLGSVAEQVLRGTDLPMMLMHPSREQRYQRTATAEPLELEVHA